MPCFFVMHSKKEEPKNRAVVSVFPSLSLNPPLLVCVCAMHDRRISFLVGTIFSAGKTQRDHARVSSAVLFFRGLKKGALWGRLVQETISRGTEQM